jgi:hypothetical protein
LRSLLHKRSVGATAALAIGFVAASAAPVMARPAPDEKTCTDYGTVAEAPKGSIPRDDFVQHKGADPVGTWAEANPDEAAAATAADPVTIEVVFHVIQKNDSLSGGNVPDEQIDDQIDVLNEAFASSGFQFELTEVTRTTKPSWFNLISAQGAEPRLFRGSGKEVKMKKALHTGDSETLNIYSSSLGQFLLGWAWLPWDFDDSLDQQPLPRFYDGVVVDYRSLPDGAFTNYGEGDTATHEVGHWLGLYHTFSNGCEEPGDWVEDTPYEAAPAFGCPTGRDTCDKPGLDPINNFMDYTYDGCMFEFSPGQGERMQQTWAAFRSLS